MPMHDWTRVRANRYHFFHHDWITEIARALNRGRLPDGYFAMAEQVTGGPKPDVVTLSVPTPSGGAPHGGVLVADRPVHTRVRATAVVTTYARKANRIAVRHPDGDVVAVIEIVSPGNKESRHAAWQFARKATALLHAGIHLLVVDPFPPTRRDPRGMHKLIWDRLHDDPFDLPPGQPLTLAAYSAGQPITAYVENVGVGDSLPDMPVFLTPDWYVPCPLEAAYEATWAAFPTQLKEPLLAPAASGPAA